MTALPHSLCDLSLLSGAEVSAFLTAGRIFVFEPETRAQVATALYHADGGVEMAHVSAGADRGRWGMEGDCYWTRYARFREGSRNAFFLAALGGDTVQAYFSDGTRAFMQSLRPALELRT